MRAYPALLLLGFAVLFFIFSYNSGYGYDALEYLLLARSLEKGYQLYDFIPSKSYLLYSSTYTLLNVLGGYNHVSISLLITLLAVGVVAASYWAVQPLGKRAALLAAVLTAIGAFFMEMNYLEPESWVAALGLLAFGIVIRGFGVWWRWLLAGVLLGIAMCFKSVAAFYVAGFGAFIGVLWLVKHETFGQMIGRGALVLAGFAIPLLLSAGYFALTNRLDAHLEWTYIYPLGGYPPHTLFLQKFVVKLSWLLLLLLVSGVLVWQRPLRKVYARTPTVWLALLLALFSCAAMLKTQASHYFFPAAVFFNVHLGFLADRLAGDRRIGTLPKRWGLAGSLLLVLGGVGVWLYRPDAVARMAHVASYDDEKALGDYLRQKVGPNGRLLVFDNSLGIYFATDQLPTVPFVFTEMQTTHYVEKHPDVYAKALADTALKLVIVDNRRVPIDDSTAVGKPGNANALAQFRQALQAHYKPVYDSTLRMNYWIRK